MLRAVDRATVRVSAGSAVVLRLESWPQEVPPTTAYLMVGERCRRDCAFCAQARGSSARADLLSRVSWPRYPLPDVARRVGRAFAEGVIERCCLQVTAGPGYVARTRQAVRAIVEEGAVPLCVCLRATRLSLFDELLGLGAQRVTLALDAACERVYNEVKGPDWQRTLLLLRRAAERHPGRVGTHIMVGLGETEAEVAGLLQAMQDAGIMTALFAFTPVTGTALAHRPAPPLASYRRLQVARHLICSSHARAERFAYSRDGQIRSYGVELARLRALLQNGQAFRTSGCPGCNRPYYNERPGGPLYNYPCALRPEEVAAATAMVLDSLAKPHGPG